MKYIFTMLVVLLLHSCNAEMKTRKHIDLVLKSGKTEKYVKGIACMRYISQPGSDIGYSKNLIKKLLSLGFFAESINAVDCVAKEISSGSGALLSARSWVSQSASVWIGGGEY